MLLKIVETIKPGFIASEFVPLYTNIMANTYPKNEKIKSRSTIDALFSTGKSVSKYPLRLVYVPQVFDDGTTHKIGVSVSKKYFKKAVDRNYYKRLLRESYRLNKSLLVGNLEQHYAFMLLYQSKDRLSFAEIQLKTVQLFEKLHAEIQKQP